jgi:hypothetical protein
MTATVCRLPCSPLFCRGGAPTQSWSASPRLLRFAKNENRRPRERILTNLSEGHVQTASYRQKLAEEIAAGIRGRSSVASRLTSTRVATAEIVPYQPYIDQTRMHDSGRSRSKKKSSKSKSSKKKKKSSKSIDSEASSTSKAREG